jgi:polar amino acid transport system permease protein
VSISTPSASAADEPYVDPERSAFLARRGRRDVGIASLSTTVVLILVVWGVTSTPGWPAVHEQFLSGSEFRASFPDILRGFWLNVRLFCVAEVLILIVALAIALLRGLSAPVFLPFRLLAALFVDVFRGVPTLLLVFLLGFGVPALEVHGLTSSVTVWGTVALVVSYSAYVAEVYRAGIESVHPSQRAAARSLGLSGVQTLRHVVLPQAVRRVLPPLLNDFVSLQKDTALVAVLGPIEALRAAQIYESSDFNSTPLVAAALLFIALTIPLARLTDWMLARERRQQSVGVR